MLLLLIGCLYNPNDLASDEFTKLTAPSRILLLSLFFYKIQVNFVGIRTSTKSAASIIPYDHYMYLCPISHHPCEVIGSTLGQSSN